MKGLREIQQALKVGKNSFNSFGKYNYRKCEDIIEAAKPLLDEYQATVTLSDSVSDVAGVLVLTVTATYTDADGKSVSCTSCAGVDVHKKGMDVAQSFGSSSSYARKYALGGLFLIDNNDDPDSADNSNSNGLTPKLSKLEESRIDGAIDAIKTGKTNVKAIIARFEVSPDQMQRLIAAETEYMNSQEQDA